MDVDGFLGEAAFAYNMWGNNEVLTSHSWWRNFGHSFCSRL